MTAFFFMMNVEDNRCNMINYDFVYLDADDVPVFTICIYGGDNMYQINNVCQTFHVRFEIDYSLPIENELRDYLENQVPDSFESGLTRDLQISRNDIYGLLLYIFKYRRPDRIHKNRYSSNRESLNSDYEFNWSEYARFYYDERHLYTSYRRVRMQLLDQIYRRYKERRFLKSIQRACVEVLDSIPLR